MSGEALDLCAEVVAATLTTRLALGSSRDMTWTTPKYVFDALDLEFGFTLDPCAWPETAKCGKFYSPHENGLAQDWSGERVFMNPPYGVEIAVWMRKARAEAAKGALVVCLVPARTDTEWWHDSAQRGEVRFLRKRIKNATSGQRWPFPSAVVVFRPMAFRVAYTDLFSKT